MNPTHVIASIDIWITLWTVLLAVSLTIFAGLAVIVSWRGFFDVRELFRRLSQQHDHSKRGRS